MLLILYVFASFGLAFALGYGKITLPLRSFLGNIVVMEEMLGEQDPTVVSHRYSRPVRFLARWLLALLECPACLAFWMGIASIFTPIAYYIPSFGFSSVFLALFLGFGNMGAVLSLGLWTNLIKVE